MFKRTSDSSFPSSSPKRLRTSYGSSSPSTSSSVFYPTSYASSSTIPTDSPSNPVGLLRTLSVPSVPARTPFGEHIALRFQLVSRVRRHLHDESETNSGTYRIVQVPRNYNFRLLQELMVFLFDRTALERIPALPFPKMPTRHRRSPRIAGKRDRTTDNARRRKKAMRAEKRSDHTFEVLHDVQYYRGKHKPGVIKPGSGHVRAKLSSESERAFFAHLFDEDPSDSVHMINTQDADEEGWSWEPEDEYMLRDVWPERLDLGRAIIYHHAPGVEVHITLNTARIPQRKGSGNTPYVFRARGSGWYDEVDDEVDDEPENAGTLSRLDEWNKYNAFSRFLGRFREPAFPVPSSPLSSPTNQRRFSDFSSSSLPPSSPPPSSPYMSRSSIGSYDLSSPTRILNYRSYPAMTPAPSHPSHRMRVERASRRIERLTRSGLAEMDFYDSSAVQEEETAEDEDLQWSDDESDKERGYRIKLGVSSKNIFEQQCRGLESTPGAEVDEDDEDLADEEEVDEEEYTEDEEPEASWLDLRSCMDRQRERRTGIFLDFESMVADELGAPCFADPPIASIAPTLAEYNDPFLGLGLWYANKGF